MRDVLKRMADQISFTMEPLPEDVYKRQVLGLFITLALFRPEQKWFITLAIALGFCILYAASDEIHQLFVPGRGAQFRDVMIDFSGAILGSGISTGINLLRCRR